MAIELRQRNGIYYIIGTDPDGRRIRRTTGTRDRRIAEQVKTQYEARAWQSHIYGEENVKTFDEAAIAYVKDGGEQRFILKVAEYFRGVPLKKITPAMIRQAARDIYPNCKPSTQNRQAINVARAVINFAHEQGWCEAIRVQKFTEDKPKRAYVERDYLDTLLPHCRPNLAACILFMNQTGRRVGEACRVERRHINFKAMTIDVPKTKNGEPFTVHMTAELAERLTELDGSPLFGYSSRWSINTALKRATKRAGLPYVSSHQIGRHSFGAALWRENWDSKRIADAGGWKTPRLVEDTYAHAEPLTKEAAKIMAKKRNKI